MANYTFKKHEFSVMNKVDGRVVRSFVVGYVTHDENFICAGHDKHPRITVSLYVYKCGESLWYVIDPETGTHIGVGKTRKEALESYENRYKAEYERIYMTQKHKDAAARFLELEKLTGRKDAEQQEQGANLVAETSLCYWYDAQVEGAKQATKGKHAGMWWVRKAA